MLLPFVSTLDMTTLPPISKESTHSLLKNVDSAINPTLKWSRTALSGTGRESYSHKEYHTIILGCQKADRLESGLAISNNILQFVFMDKKFHFTPIISGYDTINLYFLKYSTVLINPSDSLNFIFIKFLSFSPSDLLEMSTQCYTHDIQLANSCIYYTYFCYDGANPLSGVWELNTIRKEIIVKLYYYTTLPSVKSE